MGLKSNKYADFITALRGTEGVVLKGKHCEVCVSIHPCASCKCPTCANDYDGCCTEHFKDSCDTRECPDYVEEDDDADT